MATFLVTTGSFTTTDTRVTSTQPMLKLQLVVFDCSPERRQSVLPFGQLDLYLGAEQLSMMFCCSPGRPVHPLLHANEFLLGKLRNVLPLFISEEELSARGELLVSYLMGIVPYVLLQRRDIIVGCRYHFIYIPPPIHIVGEDMEFVDGVLLLGNITDGTTAAAAATTTTTTRRAYVSNSTRLLLLNLSVSSSLFSDNSSDFEEATGEEEAWSCAICLEKYVEAEHLTRVSCSHVFHWKCLVRWVLTMQKNTCPLCRNHIIRLFI